MSHGIRFVSYPSMIKEFQKVSEYNVCVLEIMEINHCAKKQSTE